MIEQIPHARVSRYIQQIQLYLDFVNQVYNMETTIGGIPGEAEGQTSDRVVANCPLPSECSQRRN